MIWCDMMICIKQDKREIKKRKRRKRKKEKEEKKKMKKKVWIPLVGICGWGRWLSGIYRNKTKRLRPKYRIPVSFGVE